MYSNKYYKNEISKIGISFFCIFFDKKQLNWYLYYFFISAKVSNRKEERCLIK